MLIQSTMFEIDRHQDQRHLSAEAPPPQEFLAAENELCTNATKFGGLSVPAGRVAIAWTLDPKTQRLHLSWTETNGPVVQAPAQRGFGSRLIENLGKQLKGDVGLTYEPSGFVYAFDVPLASLTSKATE